jgi:hypothetical protein
MRLCTWTSYAYVLYMQTCHKHKYMNPYRHPHEFTFDTPTHIQTGKRKSAQAPVLGLHFLQLLLSFFVLVVQLPRRHGRIRLFQTILASAIIFLSLFSFGKLVVRCVHKSGKIGKTAEAWCARFFWAHTCCTIHGSCDK